MATIALHSAATGLRALSTRIDVVANNLANAETNGFKRSRVNFEDLMYLMMKQPGVSNSDGTVSPAGIYVGLGTKVSNTQLDMEQGSMESTGRPLDVAISGNGFFKVKIMDGVSDGFGYTRTGAFMVNKDGDLVLGMGDGYRVEPKITIPQGTADNTITIASDGTVSILKPGATVQTKLGQLMLSQFINPQGFNQLGGNIYTATESSGKAIDTKPGSNGSGTLQQNYLEGSNVDPVKELVTLIKTPRAFELNSQSIQTADQALQTIGNLRRG